MENTYDTNLLILVKLQFHLYIVENGNVRIPVTVAAVIGWCLTALFAISTLCLYIRYLYKLIKCLIYSYLYIKHKQITVIFTSSIVHYNYIDTQHSSKIHKFTKTNDTKRYEQHIALTSYNNRSESLHDQIYSWDW